MRQLFLIGMLLCLPLMGGCTQMGQAKEMISGVYAQYQDLEAKQEKSEQDLADLEAKYGNIDADLNGKLTLAEGSKMMANIATKAVQGDKDAQDDLKDPGTWAAVLLGILGIVKTGQVVKSRVLNPKPPNGTPS